MRDQNGIGNEEMKRVLMNFKDKIESIKNDQI